MLHYMHNIVFPDNTFVKPEDASSDKFFETHNLGLGGPQVAVRCRHMPGLLVNGLENQKVLIRKEVGLLS